MPLVKSTDDDAFVEEVRAVMDDHCRRKREHTSAMIEEYLRRREKQFEDKVRHEIACQEEKARQEKHAHEDATAKVLERLSRAHAQLARVANNLGGLNSSRIQQRYFHRWLHIRAYRRETRGREAQYRLLLSRLSAFHCFGQWRLFVAARREHRQQVRQTKRFNTREKELLQRVDGLTGELDVEKRRSEELDEKLKEAFVRGISALNREAFQALRGDQSEGDIAAIEEILGKSTTQRSSAAASPRKTEVGQTEAPARKESGSGICPVHMLDAERNFYHRCYAPSTCEYGPRKAANAASSHTPFYVRVDSKGVPSYNAGPVIKTQSTRTTGRR
ncbi:unnamed protein product [Phytomonas sp. EM1]|nr:unnamed protein product [Phytomonas sp. EM1]|eukprot:CCW60128.1 unnamed protein product [Phytomonas sp. isolate EM1]